MSSTSSATTYAAVTSASSATLQQTSWATATSSAATSSTPSSSSISAVSASSVSTALSNTATEQKLASKEELAKSVSAPINSSTSAQQLQVIASANGNAVTVGGSIAMHMSGSPNSVMIGAAGSVTVTQHIHNPPITGSADISTWNLPLANDEWFTGREKELKQLNEILAQKTSHPIVISAISGLGGVGKTQLATYYIYHPEQKYEVRLWFHADDASILYSDYERFCQELKLIAPVQGEEKLKKEEVLFALNHYLQKHPNYLAVYDNAGPYSEIEALLPKQGGHIIITTRLQEYHDLGSKVEVDVFSEAEALQYLKKVIQRDEKELTAEDKALKALAAKLGYLPLALAQAGAYIKRQKIAIVDYLDLYDKNAKEMLEDTTLPKYSKSDPVAVTWNISLKAINADEAKAQEPKISAAVLCAMSYLHANQIPRTLLSTWLGTWLEIKKLADKSKAGIYLNKAIGHLTDYSMIQANPKTLNVHCLVQEVVRLPVIDTADIKVETKGSKEEKKSEMAVNSEAIAYLNSLARSLDNESKLETQILEDEARRKSLLFHMLELIKHYEKCPENFSKRSKEFAALLFIVGYILFNQAGDSENARKNYEKALKVNIACYGPNHFEVAKTLSNLACVYVDLGRTKDQKALLERAKLIFITYNDTGSSDLYMAMTLANLACVYGEMGDFRTQKSLSEKALKILEVKSELHPLQLAAVLNNLGKANGALGDFIQAKSLLNRALTIKQRCYMGVRHPDIAVTMYNLARVHLFSGETELAISFSCEALAIMKECYGSEHKYTKEILNFYEICQTVPSRDHASDEKLTTTMENVALEIILESLCQPIMLELLQQNNFMKASFHFQKLGLEFYDRSIHYSCSKHYLQKQNLLGAILHLEVMLKLMEKEAKDVDAGALAAVHCELGCYHYSYANQQKRSGETKVTKEKANQHFFQSLKLAPHPGIRTKFANVLLREDLISKAIVQLKEALILSSIAVHFSAANVKSNLEPSLAYNKVESSTLDATLQAELDYWQQINIKVIPLAHYLLITAYCKQNNLEAAKKLLTAFNNIAIKEKNPLIFSLLGAAQMLVQDYVSAMASYQKALQLKPDYTIAKRNLALLALNATSLVYPKEIPEIAAKIQVKKETKESNSSSASLLSSSASIFASASTSVAETRTPSNSQSTSNVTSATITTDSSRVSSSSINANPSSSSIQTDGDDEELQLALKMSLGKL